MIFERIKMFKFEIKCPNAGFTVLSWYLFLARQPNADGKRDV